MVVILNILNWSNDVISWAVGFKAGSSDLNNFNIAD